MPAPRIGAPASSSVHSSSVARRCTPSSPYSVESSASASSTGAPSGSQRIAASCSSPCVSGAGGARRGQREAGRRRRRRFRSTVAALRVPRSWGATILAAGQAQNVSPMSRVEIRPADPEADAAACAAIYAPYRRGGATSFEETPPGAAEIGARIEAYSATHPWLVAERGGEVVGYAYACGHRIAAGLPLVGRRLGLRRCRPAGPGSRPRALRGALRAHFARAASGSPARGSPCPTRRASALHERLGFVPVGVYRGIGWKAGGWRRRRLVAARAGRRMQRAHRPSRSEPTAAPVYHSVHVRERDSG